MELTKGQKEGKEKTIEWFNSDSSKQIFEISGYAGTGKSTLVYSIIDELGINMEDVAFATFTGKAALVLSLKGCPATTIHKLIYIPESELLEMKDSNNEVIKDEEDTTCYENKVSFIKKEKLPENIKLIVLDECSMIDEKMLEDLKSFKIPIIVLGDIFQLPPISGEPVLLKNPDVLLTEIMRQKEGDPIVHLATLAREGKYIPYGKFGHSYVIDKKELDIDIDNNLGKFDKVLTKSDIVLCRKNITRERLNNHIRSNIYGITKKIPTMNDKIICRKNNWDLQIRDELDINLVNGLIGNVVSPITSDDIKMEASYFRMDFRPEMCKEDFFESIPVSTLPFVNLSDKEKKILEYKQYKIFSKKKLICNKFEFAYAITVHLSQGSQWKRVFIYDEKFNMYEKENYNKSLYTAITRAEKQVILAK